MGFFVVDLRHINGDDFIPEELLILFMEDLNLCAYQYHKNNDNFTFIYLH